MPLPFLSEAIVIAILTGVFAVIIELIRRMKKSVDSVNDQVKNTHSTNLRDDLDKVNTMLIKVDNELTMMNLRQKTSDEERKLDAIQHQVEHAKLWQTMTGEPDMPPTQPLEIIQVLKKEGH